MGFFQDFRAFVARGNVVDLAVGVIIGGAFGGIVTALVNDILMPPIGLITGKVDFKDRYLPLDGNVYQTLAEAKKNTSVIMYGDFINAVVNFVIIAFVIFLVIRAISKLMPKPVPVPPPGPTPDQVLLTEIRDLLAKDALPRVAR